MSVAFFSSKLAVIACPSPTHKCLGEVEITQEPEILLKGLTYCPLIPHFQSRIHLAQVLSYHMTGQDKHSADDFLPKDLVITRITPQAPR